MKNITVIYILLFLSVQFVNADQGRMIYEPVFNGSVFVREAGSAENQTVVLVHGAGEEASHVWDKLIPALAQNYHVLTFDLPGYGKSEKKNLLYSPDRYATFIRWIIDEYNTGPIDLIGHSMGASLALCFAGTYPNSVKRLALIDLYGVLHRDVLTRYFTLNKTNRKNGMHKAPWKIVSGLVNSISNMFKDKSINRNISQILNDPIARKTTLGGKPSTIASLALVNYDFGWTLDRVSAPTLILWGEYDRIAPIRTAHLLLYKIPESQLKIIRGAGHTPPLEQKSMLNKKVLHFLNSDSLSGRDKLRLPLPEERKRRVVYNIRKYDQIYNGYYDSLFVKHSKRVLIENVQAKYIDIRSSTVTIKNSIIEGQKTGLYIAASTVNIENSEIRAQIKAVQSRGADVVMTGVTLKADTALAVSRSKFDIAGSKLSGVQRAISHDANNRARLPVPDNSDFLFSVSILENGNQRERIHGKMKVNPRPPH